MQAEMRATPGDSPALVAAGPPGAYVSSDVAAPSAALGRRHKVPMLNLSRESLRMSVEAITPPCSFPLRAQVWRRFNLLAPLSCLSYW